jgi:hypothetical protein
MSELTDLLRVPGGQGDYVGTLEALWAIGLSLLCAMGVAWTYRQTHKGTGYSQNYNQSLILMALVTTVIMIVIGSNIARAFSLVGALSIIRFRNAVKETRDVAYIFLAMAIAMACGTRFYQLAIISTACACALMLGMHAVNYGSHHVKPERLLAVQLPSGVAPEVVLEPELARLFQTFSLVSLENSRQGLFLEALYSVRPLPGISGSRIIDAISRINNNLKITYNFSAHVDDI